MTLSDITYLKTEFGNDFDLETFRYDLQNSSFSLKIRGVGNSPTQVIVTVENISGAETTELDNLVSNHNPINLTPKRQFFTISLETVKTTNSSYTSLGTFNYLGSDAIGAINYVEIVAKTTHANTTFDVRIYDVTNDKVLCEKTGLNNQSFQTIDLGTISNVPTNSAILEVHTKRSGSNKNIIIHQVSIYYGNE